MTIISRVCAQFHDKKGKPIYTIRRDQLLQPLTDVPDEIQRDRLFRMLVDEKTLEVLTRPEDVKRAENDPEKKPERSGGAKNNSAVAAEKKEKN